MLKTPLLNTLVQILGKIVMVAISLLTTGLLTRGLGLKVYGDFILITSLLIFFDTLADFGSKIIGVRESAKSDSTKKFSEISVWTNMAVLRIFIALISFGLGIIFIFSWSDLAEVRWTSIVAFAMILLTSIAGSMEIVWQTRQKMFEKVIVEILFPTVFLVGFWFYGASLGLVGVFYLYLIARIVTLGLGMVKLNQYFNFKLIDKKMMLKLLNLSWPMGIYLLLFTAYDRAIDATMISRFLGKPEVAMYGLSYKIYGALLQPAYFLMNSLFPILSSNVEGKRNLFWKSLLIMTLSAVLLILGVQIFAPAMVNLLGGNEFFGSISVLRLLIVAVFFSYIGHLFGFSLISKNGQKEMVLLGVVVLIFNFIANLWAIPRFGMMGAAGVTVLSEAWAMVLMGMFLYKKSR
jgi:O-antigen/teichoic acid export membrane protein